MRGVVAFMQGRGHVVRGMGGMSSAQAVRVLGMDRLRRWGSRGRGIRGGWWCRGWGLGGGVYI